MIPSASPRAVAAGAWRRLVFTLAALLVLTPRDASAHAALLRSTPRAGTTVGSELTQVRLEFSEEVVPDLCHIALMTPQGSHVDLRPAGDPHDASAIVAPLSALAPGRYRVMWHAVSADGHPVEGEFAFSVNGPAPGITAAAETAVPPAKPMPMENHRDGSNSFPALAALSKGIGMAALLAVAGLLLFSLKNGGSALPAHRRWAVPLAALATLFLVLHALAWGRYVMAPAEFTTGSALSVFAHGPGRLETARVILCLLALIVLSAGVSSAIALVLAAAAIVVTSAMGHPAAQHALLSVPLILLHLLAVAVWAGGLVSLLAARNAAPASFRSHASFVSMLAFIAVIVLSLTGLIESLVLLTSPSDLVSTAYGRWIIAKAAGLFILVLFGWHHRFRALPALTNDEPHGMTVSLRMETAVMTATILAAAFLSYTPTPR